MKKTFLPPLLASLASLAVFTAAPLPRAAAAANMMSKVQRITDRPGSEMLSIFNACPESPDGKWICYAYYPTAGKSKTSPVQLIIRERATGQERVLADAKADFHNGLNAIWLDERTIAFQTYEGKKFGVADVVTGKRIVESMTGNLPHKSSGGLLYFARDAGNTPGAPADWGVWELNWKTGATRLVISQDQLYKTLRAFDPKALNGKVALLHTDPSPDNKRVAVAYRYFVAGEKKPVPALVYFDAADGANAGVLKNRPMHPLWYDNENFMGVFTQNGDHLISRYNLAGDRVEKMAGVVTHDSISPDKKWFAGETSYYKPAPDGYTRIALYRRGEMQPAAILAEWKSGDADPTWQSSAHVSCSFSADGQRVYFTRVNAANRVEACVFDMKNMAR